MIEVKQYLIEKIKSYHLDKSKLYNHIEYKKFLEATNSDANYSSYQRIIRDYYIELLNDFDNISLYSDEIVKLDASKQALQDKNRVIKKVNREQNRLYNNLKELYDNYVEVLRENSIDLKKIKIKSEKIQNNKSWGILHLSDIHANKKIEKKEFLDNEYNFTIFSKRLKKFITESIFYFKAKNIKNVCVIMTGDILTSDRRASEMLTRCTNQVKASLLTSYILKQALLELNQNFGLKIAYCTGNESRLDDFMYSDEILATNNYDYLIYNNLRIWLENTNIKFDTSGSAREKLLNLGDFNCVLLHGDTLKSRDVGKEIKTVISKYNLNGTKINGVFCGHIHSSVIGDVISRSSSMVGRDIYSLRDLHCIDGRAASNIYLINKDNSYDGIKIDLQDVTGYIGYDIKQELEVYHIDEGIKPNTEVVIRNFV